MRKGQSSSLKPTLEKNKRRKIKMTDTKTPPATARVIPPPPKRWGRPRKPRSYTVRGLAIYCSPYQCYRSIEDCRLCYRYEGEMYQIGNMGVKCADE